MNPQDLKKLIAEYTATYDVMDNDDARTHYLKVALSKVPEADRVIFCLYLDLGSSRKVGKLLGVSHSTILTEVKKIKNLILENYKKYERDMENY